MKLDYKQITYVLMTSAAGKKNHMYQDISETWRAWVCYLSEINKSMKISQQKENSDMMDYKSITILLICTINIYVEQDIQRTTLPFFLFPQVFMSFFYRLLCKAKMCYHWQYKKAQILRQPVEKHKYIKKKSSSKFDYIHKNSL